MAEIILQRGEQARPSKFSLSREGRIIIGTLLAAILLGLAINSFLGGEVRNPQLWLIVTIVTVVIAVCVAAIGVVLDRQEAAKRRQYLSELDRVREEGSARYRNLLKELRE